MGGFTAAVECGKAGHVIMVGEWKGASSIKENLREPWHAGRLCNGSGEREGRTKMKVASNRGRGGSGSTLWLVAFAPPVICLISGR